MKKPRHFWRGFNNNSEIIPDLRVKNTTLLSYYITNCFYLSNLMRLHSTWESVSKMELSALAILETVLAISISIWISIHLDTILYILISTLIAPFLMLRTQASITQGLNWATIANIYIEKISSPFNKKKKPNINSLTYIFSLLLIAVLILLTAITIKIGATVKTLFTHPIDCIKAIPLNWWKISLSTDIRFLPEILPDSESPNIKEFTRIPRLSRISLDSQLFRGNFINRILAYILFVIIFSILFIPPLLYRFSLKSTSYIYFPFIWIVNNKTTNENYLSSLELIRRSQFEKLRVYFSFAVIIITLVPIFTNLALLKIGNIIPNTVMLKYFIPVYSIDSWHISRLIAAMITIVIFWLADKYLIIYRNQPNYNFQISSMLINSLSKIRTSFSLWTIVCGIYLLNQQMNWSDLPTINWIPW